MIVENQNSMAVTITSNGDYSTRPARKSQKMVSNVVYTMVGTVLVAFVKPRKDINMPMVN